MSTSLWKYLKLPLGARFKDMVGWGACGVYILREGLLVGNMVSCPEEVDSTS